jgi:hypothetical protein
MSGPLDIWRQAAAKWSEVYGQVTESQWDRPTPCDEWTAFRLPCSAAPTRSASR